MALNRTHTVAAGLGGLFIAPLLLALQFGGCVPVPGGVDGGKPGPKPEPTFPTATHVVMVVDTKALTTPLGIVLDSPRVTAMKLAGMFSVVGLNEPFMKEKNYGPAVDIAGGASALLFLNDKETDNLVLATRTPTDLKALDELLSKHVIGLPPPMAAYPEYRFQRQGQEIKIKKSDSGEESFEDQDGTTRLLTAKSSPVRFAALPKYADHYPLIPRAEWRDINRAHIFSGTDWIYNQGQHGSCVGWGWAGALRRARVLWGMKDESLSGTFLYAWLNGGKDNGAVISDGIEAAKTHGLCPFDMFGPDKIWKSQIPAAAKEEAKRYTAIECYRCDSFDEAMSAMQTGLFTVVYGYRVGDNFNKSDKQGVPGFEPGQGNHCNHAEGCKKLADGKWYFDDVNSWGKWGPFLNGHCYIGEKHLQPNVMPDFCVIRLPGRDPKEPFEPPSYRPKAKAAGQEHAIAA